MVKSKREREEERKRDRQSEREITAEMRKMKMTRRGWQRERVGEG